VQFLFLFFCSNIPYKKHNEVKNLFLEDLVLFMITWLFPLNTCENVWMRRMTLKLDPKLLFPFQRTLFEDIILAMVARCLDLHMQLQFDATLSTTATFDLWMNRG